MPRSFIIDSRDRQSGSLSSSDFALYLNDTEGISAGKVLIDWAVIPKQWYNVSANLSNVTIAWADTTTALSTTLTTKNYYSGDELATELAAAMTASSAATGATDVIGCSFDSQTGKLTFTTDGTTMNIKFSTSDTNLPVLCGYAATDTGAVASGNSALTSTYAINLNQQTYLYIQSGDLQPLNRIMSGNATDSSGQNLLTIPVCSVDYGKFIEYQDQSATWSHISQIHQKRLLHFRLVFQNGTAVNLNNADWCMSLTICD